MQNKVFTMKNAQLFLFLALAAGFAFADVEGGLEKATTFSESLPRFMQRILAPLFSVAFLGGACGAIFMPHRFTWTFPLSCLGLAAIFGIGPSLVSYAFTFFA